MTEDLLKRGIEQYICHHCMEDEYEEFYEVLKKEWETQGGYLGDPRYKELVYQDGEPTSFAVIAEILAGAFSDDRYIYYHDIPQVLEFMKPLIEEYHKWLEGEA